MGCDGVAQGTGEEGVENPGEGGLADPFSGLDRTEGELPTAFLALDEFTFGFEDSDDGAKGRAGRGIVDVFQNLGQGGLAQGEDNLQDFPFAATEI